VPKKLNLEELANKKAQEEEVLFNKMTKEEKSKHYESVRNEGILQAFLAKKSKKLDTTSEINLEIEEPGAAN
jgi:hypothetical protein